MEILLKCHEIHKNLEIVNFSESIFLQLINNVVVVQKLPYSKRYIFQNIAPAIYMAGWRLVGVVSQFVAPPNVSSIRSSELPFLDTHSETRYFSSHVLRFMLVGLTVGTELFLSFSALCLFRKHKKYGENDGRSWLLISFEQLYLKTDDDSECSDQLPHWKPPPPSPPPNLMDQYLSKTFA